MPEHLPPETALQVNISGESQADSEQAREERESSYRDGKFLSNPGAHAVLTQKTTVWNFTTI
jgi:hypothetical protein